MQQNKRPLLIGITGGMGCGKSTVSAIITERYPVVSADLVAKLFLEEPSVRGVLQQRWGTDVYENDQPHYDMIARIVFNDPSELKFLDLLIHPLVLAKFQVMVEDSDADVLCFEIPLLFEAGLQDCFDYIVTVWCHPAMQLERIMARHKTTPESIEQRMQAQMSQDEKRRRADKCFENNDDMIALKQQVDSFIALIPSIPRRSIRAFTSVLSHYRD